MPPAIAAIVLLLVNFGIILITTLFAKTPKSEVSNPEKTD